MILPQGAIADLLGSPAPMSSKRDAGNIGMAAITLKDYGQVMPVMSTLAVQSESPPISHLLVGRVSVDMALTVESWAATDQDPRNIKSHDLVG